METKKEIAMHTSLTISDNFDFIIYSLFLTFFVNHKASYPFMKWSETGKTMALEMNMISPR